ncbi:hypothetical protein ACTFIZ_002859 [Dictyostelium cf. discoideum]
MLHKFGPIYRIKRFRRAQRLHRERINRERNLQRQRLYDRLYPRRIIENGNIFIDSFNSINRLTKIGHELLEISQSPFQQIIKKIFVVFFQDYFSLPVNIEQTNLELVLNSINNKVVNQPKYQFQVKILTFKTRLEDEYPPHMQIIINGKNVIEQIYKIKKDTIDNGITVFYYNPIDVSQNIQNNNNFTINTHETIGVLILQIVKINSFISTLNLANL